VRRIRAERCHQEAGCGSPTSRNKQADDPTRPCFASGHRNRSRPERGPSQRLESLARARIQCQACRGPLLTAPSSDARMKRCVRRQKAHRRSSRKHPELPAALANQRRSSRTLVIDCPCGRASSRCPDASRVAPSRNTNPTSAWLRPAGLSQHVPASIASSVEGSAAPNQGPGEGEATKEVIGVGSVGRVWAFDANL